MRGRRPRGGVPRRGSGPGRRRVGRALWPAFATLALVLVLFIAVFPTRTLLAQREATSEAERQLAVLTEQNAALSERAAQLRDDREIERLARERYNLVMPGEEAYALLPAARSTTTVPPVEEPGDRNPVQQLWDGITGLP